MGFLKHSRVYTRVLAHKAAYVWLLTIFSWSQLFSAHLQYCLVSLILFGISGVVPVLIILFLMFWWRCLDDLLVKVFRMHKLRGSLSHMKRTRGCTDSGGAVALLSIMHCWHYDGSETCSLSWGLSRCRSLNGHFCNLVKRSCWDPWCNL